MSLITRSEPPMEDAEGLVAFLQAHVNPEMDTQAYAWQFAEIPSAPVLMVVRQDGGIVSTQSFLPHVIMRGATALDTLKSEHSFLSPSFRGTPVFTDAYSEGLRICAAQGRTVCWGYTPAVKVWRDRLGFMVFPGCMREQVTMLAPSPIFADPTLRGVLRAAREHLLHFKARLMDRSNHGKPSWDRVSGAHPPDGVVEDLYARSCGDSHRLRMDDKFLHWRVRTNPNLEFVCKYFFRQDVLVACYMFSIHPNTPGTAHLSEFMFAEEADAEPILEHLRKDARERGARRLQYFGNLECPLNERVFALLTKAGPSQQWINEGMAFVLKDPNGLTRPELSKWYMTALWTQGFAR